MRRFILSFPLYFLLIVSIFLIGPFLVNAQEEEKVDFLSPASSDFSLQPGEGFSSQVFFVSGRGGVYDVSIKKFVFRPDGSRAYVSDDLPFLRVDKQLLELVQDQRVFLNVTGEIPSDIENADLYYALNVRMKKDDAALFTFAYQSDFYLHVGDLDNKKIFDYDSQSLEEDESLLKAFKVKASNPSSTYFQVFPKLLLLDKSGSVLRSIDGGMQRAFPKSLKFFSVSNLTGNDIVFDDVYGVKFKLFSRDGFLFLTRDFDVPRGQIFKSQARQKTPYDDVQIVSTVSKSYSFVDWLYSFVFAFFGVFLIWYSLKRS